MSPDEAARLSVILQAYRALAQNAAWAEEIAPRMEKAAEEHLNGCTSRAASPEKRAEHVEAYHLASTLAGHVPRRIAELEDTLREYYRRVAERATG